MVYYVVIRHRSSITVEYLNSIYNTPGKLPNWAWIYGPFQTFEEAKIAYQEVLQHVDDDDHGIFAINVREWYRYNSLSRTLQKM